MIIPVTGQNFLSQESISYHRKKIAVTGRIFISKDMISYNSQKFPFTRKNFRGMLLVVIFIIISTYDPQHFFRSDTPKCAYVILETKMSKITHNQSLVSCRNSRYLGRSFGGEKNLARRREILSHPGGKGHQTSIVSQI